MLISPEEYIPVDVAMRTTMAQRAFRSQPRRRIRRPRRVRRHTLAA